MVILVSSARRIGLDVSEMHFGRSLMFIHSLVFSLEGRAWQEPEPSHVTGMALAHCILGKFLGVVCHCFPPPLGVPTGASVRNDATNVQHGTDGFTSPPKEGMLRIFSP